MVVTVGWRVEGWLGSGVLIMFAISGGIAGEGVVGIRGCGIGRSCTGGALWLAPGSPDNGGELQVGASHGAGEAGCGLDLASGSVLLGEMAEGSCCGFVQGESSHAARNKRRRSLSDVGDCVRRSGVGGDARAPLDMLSDCGQSWVSSIEIEGGDEGGSWCGDMLGLLQEPCELEEEGEVVVGAALGGLSLWARWSSRCSWASLLDRETSHGVHTWARLSLYSSCSVPKWEMKVRGD